MRKNKPGQGRKAAYNEPTTTIAFRVPISLKDDIKAIIRGILADQLLARKND
jgi:hypothetical protein